MISTLMLLHVLQQPRTVTLTHPCAHSSVVLEALGKELGVKMAPGGSVLQDYFAVKFTERDPETIKRLIAETLNAVWVQRGEYLVLDRGPVQHAAELKATNEALLKEIEAFLATRPSNTFDPQKYRELAIEAAATVSDPQRHSSVRNALNKVSPEPSLSPRVVQALGAAWLANLPEGASLSYTLLSTGESDMPPNLLAAIKQYRSERNQASAIAESVGYDVSQVGGSGASNEEVVLSVSRLDDRISITMRTDPHSQSGAGLSMRFLANFGSLTVPDNAGLDSGVTGKLEVSDPGRSMLRMARSKLNVRREVAEQVSGVDRATSTLAAGNLVENEPLNRVGLLPLQAASSQKSRDYVALLEDNTALYGPWLINAERDPLDEVWRTWRTGVTTRLDSGTGVLVVTPLNPRRARESRFDRSAASRFASQFAAHKRITLDAMAALALACDSETSFARQLVASTRFLPVNTLSGGYHALRVFGSLSPGQKDSAQDSGIVIDWPNLPTLARETLEAFLRARERRFSDQPPYPIAWTTFAIQLQGIARPTSLGTQSIPRGSQVRIVWGRKEGLRPREPVFPENDGIFTPEIFARLLKSVSSIDQDGNQRVVPSDMLIGVVTMERIQVEVYLPGMGYTTLAARVDSITDDTAFVPAPRLPEPWKGQLAEAIKQIGVKAQ